MVERDNDVLAERINNLHNSFDEWKEDFKTKIVPQIEANTKLRHQFKGVIGTISFVSVVFGGVIMWFVGKIWGKG